MADNLEEVQNGKYLTYDQVNILTAAQKIWFKIAILVREYIKAAIYDTPNLKSLTNDLYNLPSEAYELFSIFYGSKDARNVENLLFDFIRKTMEVVEAMNFGDKVLTDTRVIKLYRSADKLASFLASINPYWDINQLKYLLYEYIKFKIKEIYIVIEGNDEEELKIFKEVENINFLFANYIGRGLIASASN